MLVDRTGGDCRVVESAGRRASRIFGTVFIDYRVANRHEIEQATRCAEVLDGVAVVPELLLEDFARGRVKNGDRLLFASEDHIRRVS